MKTVKILCGILLIFSVLFTFLFGAYRIGEKKEISKTPENSCVLTFWQIDTFEGGSGSRRQFILDVAKEFEKENKGVYVLAVNYTVEGAEKSLSSGETPDLISYGSGLNINSPVEINLEIPQNSGGKIGDKTYAAAWCRGGYVLIKSGKSDKDFSEELDGLIVSKASFNQPYLPLIENGIKAKEVKVLSPEKAYSSFVLGESEFLLGTQRDIVKLSKRNFDFSVKPLDGFCDLYQYVSILSKSEKKRYFAEKFINYLLKEETQRKLSKINMFSVNFKGEYGEETEKLQNARLNKTVSAFIGREKSQELFTLSERAFKGSESDLNNINKMLITY